MWICNRMHRLRGNRLQIPLAGESAPQVDHILGSAAYQAADT